MGEISRRTIEFRQAEPGDEVVLTSFGRGGTRGFAAVGDPSVAVSLPPGTEVRFAKPVACEPTGGNMPQVRKPSRAGGTPPAGHRRQSLGPPRRAGIRWLAVRPAHAIVRGPARHGGAAAGGVDRRAGRQCPAVAARRVPRFGRAGGRQRPADVHLIRFGIPSGPPETVLLATKSGPLGRISYGGAGGAAGFAARRCRKPPIPEPRHRLRHSCFTSTFPIDSPWIGRAETGGDRRERRKRRSATAGGPSRLFVNTGRMFACATTVFTM